MSTRGYRKWDEELHCQTHLTSIRSSVIYHGVVSWFPWSEVENYNVTPLRVVRLSKVFKMLAWGSTPQKVTQSCLALNPCHHRCLCTCFHCWVLSPTSVGPQWHLYKHSWKGFGYHDSGLFPSQTEPLAPTQASLPFHHKPYFLFKLILFLTVSSLGVAKDIVLTSRSVLCPWEKVTPPLHQLNTPGDFFACKY